MRPVEISPHLYFGVRTAVRTAPLSEPFRYIVLWSRMSVYKNREENATTMGFDNYFNKLIEEACREARR